MAHKHMNRTMAFCVRNLVALSAVFALSVATAANYTGGPHYFSWAELKMEPVKLTRPIAELEAKKREEKGEAYYVGYFDSIGQVLLVEKRFERKVFFRITYFYENGRLVRVETINADGKKTNRESKQ